MKIVDRAEDRDRAVEATAAQAGRLFGDPGILVERHVRDARHVEVQVFGLGNGRAVHLFERDCSVQRRFQKIIEETPAPNLPARVRDRSIVGTPFYFRRNATTPLRLIGLKRSRPWSLSLRRMRRAS